MASDVPLSSSGGQWRPSDEDHRFELLRIAENSWRLADRTAAAGDADYLVAFIQKVSSEFEVVWLRAGEDANRFPTLDAVLDAARAIVTRRA